MINDSFDERHREGSSLQKIVVRAFTFAQMDARFVRLRQDFVQDERPCACRPATDSSTSMTTCCCARATGRRRGAGCRATMKTERARASASFACRRSSCGAARACGTPSPSQSRAAHETKKAAQRSAVPTAAHASGPGENGFAPRTSGTAAPSFQRPPAAQ